MSIDATYMAMLVSGVTIDGTTRHTFSEVTLSDCIYNELKYLKVVLKIHKEKVYIVAPCPNQLN